METIVCNTNSLYLKPGAFVEYISIIGLIIIGITILLIGGEALVKSSVSIASRFDISPAIIGLTIVAAGTSTPEMVTSLLASLRGAPDLAMGNIIGSNIFNILAILGIASLIKPNKIPSSMMKLEMPLLILCTLILIGLTWDLLLSPFEGIICLVALCLLFYISIYRAKKMGLKSEESIEPLKNWKWDVGYLIVGITALITGAHLSLEGGIQLGQLIGLSERIIGITIISVGTGLPELATSAVAAYRGHNDIAFANVIGSNMMNTLGVAGIASAFHPITLSPDTGQLDSLIMLAITLLLIPIIILGKNKIERPSGLFLVLSYIGYVFYLFAK